MTKTTPARSDPVGVCQQESEVEFGALVDRLLRYPLTKTDAKFHTIFLCFYPKFAHPSRLLGEIIHRFDTYIVKGQTTLLSTATRMRYLSVLHQWITQHSHDFAQSHTRELLSEFLAELSLDPQYAVAYAEISSLLDEVGPNDSVGSTIDQQRRSRASTIESLISSSSTQSTSSKVTLDSSTEDSNGSGNPSKHVTARNSAPSSVEIILEPLGKNFSGSGAPPNGSDEDGRRRLPRPLAQFNLDKIRWHHLMTVSEEHIALELTRIDWMLYSAIQPRDLIKHVSLGAGNKGVGSDPEHVSAIVDQFNHVAMWVANLILLREKPKHRALMLEKFLAIAWKLRYLNNYNSLGAVIAGVNGTAVHRLSQTRAMVSSEARRQFMRLEILMGTSRSHSAYRLGWQNTTGPRIPFLPLHFRDLVSAEAGNKTVIHAGEGQKINWRKFEVMGDVILEIQESQNLPYPPIKKNHDIYGLIMESKFSKDEDVRLLPSEFLVYLIRTPDIIRKKRAA